MSNEIKVPELRQTTLHPKKCPCHLQNSSLYFSERRLRAINFFQQYRLGTEKLLASFPGPSWLCSELRGWPWVRGRKGRATIDHCFSEVSNTCFRKENIFFIHLHLNSEELPISQLCPQTLSPQSQEARSQSPLPLFWCVV